VTVTVIDIDLFYDSWQAPVVSENEDGMDLLSLYAENRPTVDMVWGNSKKRADYEYSFKNYEFISANKIIIFLFSSQALQSIQNEFQV
jgi:hypothetical protein